MKSHARFMSICAASLAFVAVLAVLGCSSAPSSSSSAGDASSSGSSAPALSASSSSANAASIVAIPLDYHAGTGYEWSWAAAPEGVLEFAGQTTDGEADAGDVTGGLLRDTFEFKPSAPGEVVLTFDLGRAWEAEGESADTQVYAFTVTDELDVILNPYKSNFKNEPIVGMGE